MKTVLSITCSKYQKEDEKIFEEEESIEILKIFGLIENIDETWNYLLEEIKQNALMSRKHKNFYTTLKLYWILASIIAGCISISAFVSFMEITKIMCKFS